MYQGYVEIYGEFPDGAAEGTLVDLNGIMDKHIGTLKAIMAGD